MSRRPDQNKIQLIGAVSQFPYLYDRLHKDYKNKALVDAKWAELAESCGFDDGEDARQTWINVVKARTHRNKNHEANGTLSKQYVYEPYLSFLDELPRNKTFQPYNGKSSPKQEWLNFMPSNGTREVDEDGQSNYTNDNNHCGEIKEPKAKKIKYSGGSHTHTNNNCGNLIRSKNVFQEFGRTRETMGEAFGRTISIALDRLKGKQQIEAQIEIVQVLLKYAEE